jgi:hypothetical protein
VLGRCIVVIEVHAVGHPATIAIAGATANHVGAVALVVVSMVVLGQVCESA